MATKFCDQCGASVRAIAKFCPNCGANISSVNSAQSKNIPGDTTTGVEISKAISEPENRSKESPGKKPETLSSGDDSINKKKWLKLPGKKLSKKALALILSIVGTALIAGIILLIVFIPRSCSNSSIASYASDKTGAAVETSFFDAMAPGLAELTSADQLAILTVDGPPQAYTIYKDLATGSIIEQWNYYNLGREINFMNGVYEGGLEVPLPENSPDFPIPELKLYPWEILKDFSPEAVISSTGAAIFNTSVLVLPGWNDYFEVARLWLLSGGGNMITVDGSLAMLNIDPGKALDLDQFTINDFLIGTLTGSNNRLGAILSPSGSEGSYRLSLSPRGQGTTQDATGFIFDLAGPGIEKEYVIGNDAILSISAIDGSETPAGEATGTVTIGKNGNGYDILINAIINGADFMMEGFMGSAVWKASDPSTAKAISDAPPLAADVQGTAPDENVYDAENQETEATETEWVPVWTETFDSNENRWPVTYGTEGESSYYYSEVFEGHYIVYGEQKKEGNSVIKRLIPLDLERVFSASVEVLQKGADNFSGCALILSDKDEQNEIYFRVSAANGSFGLIQKDSSGYSYPLDYTASFIKPPGQVNTLSVMRLGPLFYFYINSELVGRLEVENLEIDYIGLGLITYQGEKPVTCYFDNLTIYEIQ